MRVRVLHLAQRFHPAIGGAETYVREIALEQARRGHDVTVATTEHPGAPREETMERADARIRIVRFPTRHFRGDYLLPAWLPMKGVDAWLARERFDILHAHSYRFDTVEAAARAHKAHGTPYVVSALGFYPPENLAVRLSRLAYDPSRGRAALSRAARGVALTSDEVPYYEALGLPRERVDVVPPGIEEGALAPGDGAAFRKEHGLSGDVVLFLARLAHDKGLTDLVEAMADVPDATLAVVGPDAGARAAAERIARRRGIAQRVRFLGRARVVRDAYAACDVFVHPSHYESYGLVVVEAMAQSRAVVTTTAGGLPEAAGGCAALVPPRDPPALAREIRALLADPARRAEMGARGRERARTLTWKAGVDGLEACYQRALG